MVQINFPMVQDFKQWHEYNHIRTRDYDMGCDECRKHVKPWIKMWLNAELK